MVEQFRDCFVGEKGYETLKKLMRSGNDLCIEISKCFQEKYDAELAHSRALRKTSENLRKLLGRSKGSVAQALEIFAAQIDKQSEAHQSLGNVALQQISVPMKNLAENQNKNRKTLEDSLNTKIKTWKEKKEIDNKYRTRQFEKSKEIEELHLKLSEASKTSKNVAKDSTKESISSTPLVMSCVLPTGRYTKPSDKLNMQIRKAEEELETIERKYHDATKDVELSRQNWDLELCRVCDEMEQLETDRINEINMSAESYSDSMKIFSETMCQISNELNPVRISASDDLVTAVRSNVQRAETEILLYDIYAENEGNLMSDTRRLMSLQRWKALLTADLENLRRCTESSANPCQSSSSSNDDDDGAMRHRKATKKKGTDKPVLSPGSYLYQCLYRASLYKIEKVINYYHKLPEPIFEYKDHFAKPCNDKGYPLTVLRIPTRKNNETPPSAPCTTRTFVEAMPVFTAVVQSFPTAAHYSQMTTVAQIHEMPRVVQASRVVPQFTVLSAENRSYQPMLKSAPPAYPILPSAVNRSAKTMKVTAKNETILRVIYPYQAKRADELTISPGDFIVLMKHRDDGWCEGNLDGKIGLFPGNYVETYS